MQRDLTEGPITGNLLRFALPLMVGNLLQQLYNVCDTWVVGRLSLDHFLGNGRHVFVQLLCQSPAGSGQFGHAAALFSRLCGAQYRFGLGLCAGFRLGHQRRSYCDGHRPVRGRLGHHGLRAAVLP